MRRVSEQEVLSRGFRYVGKDKYYLRHCNFCGIMYEGQGVNFCGYSCSRRASPIVMFGGNNPSKRPEVRKKISDSKIGIPQHPNARVGIIKSLKGFFGKDAKNGRWIEDRTKLHKSEKKHLDGQYRDWMLSVKDRDNWSCRIADINCDGRLEAHHILNWVEYPELRYEINNGIALCRAHHPKGRAKEKQLSPYFKELVSVSNK